MIRIQIKDLQAIAADLALDEEGRLIFGRFILRSQEEVRGLRHALQAGKWIQSEAGLLAALPDLTQIWVASRLERGVTSWILTAYTPAIDEVRYFMRRNSDSAEAAARQFAAFLHQHTPYPIPPLSDVSEILERHGQSLPVSGNEAISVHAITLNQIIQILEENHP